MAGTKLARVRWSIGQTLLPEHLETQEDAAGAELRLAARTAGLPWWGVARLVWNAAQLAGGVASPSELTAVMRGGAIVDVPGNARVVAPLALDPAMARTAVYLHLLADTEEAGRAAPYADDPPRVERLLRRVVLSADAVLPSAVDSLKLAELVCDAQHEWTTAPDYVPPLLQVSPAHPYREPLLGPCESLLVVLENKLLLRLASTDRGGHGHGHGHGDHGHELAGARQCLVEVQRALARLDDLGRGICPHPYVLYNVVRDAYFAICAYVAAAADRDAAPYHHDALATTFAQLATELRIRLASATTHLTERAFVRSDGLHVVAPLPDGLHTAREVYVLVRGELAAAAPELVEAIKLAARGRLGTIHRRVLQGIPLHHVAETPFVHPFGPEVGFYLVGRNHEWELALREGSLAFHDPPGVDCRASLFWR
jgi:type VI secretion system protein ImpJ